MQIIHPVEPGEWRSYHNDVVLRAGSMGRRVSWDSRRGFTLIELLVVITIIGMLVVLLLPAVQAAREASRRAQCANNMRQLGLAAINYESQYGWFPPSSYFDSTIDPRYSRTHGRNWAISILPFLEQQPLYDSFDLSAAINDPINRTARGTDLSVMRCPSDVGHRTKFTSTDAAEGDNWARGNYAANASMAFYRATSNAVDGAGTNQPLSYSRYHRGIMGANLSMGTAEIYDGTSNTILLTEVRIGMVAIDRRGTWALDQPGASSLWANGWGDGNGPNVCTDKVDDMIDCNLLVAAAGGVDVSRAMCMTCSDGTQASQQGVSRSRHHGGMNVTMADGSVHFLSNYIEKGDGNWQNTPTTPNVSTQFLCWQRLCASQDGLTIDASKY